MTEMKNTSPPNLYALKADWSWVKLGDVCKVRGGFAFKSTAYKKEGVPLVRISNITDKKVSLEECIYIDSSFENKAKEFLLQKGDILIALSGATTGKYGIYNLEEKAFLNQRIGRLHFNGSDKIIPTFIYLYLEIIRAEILKTAYGAAQPNISPSEIADFPIPLPPLPEQKKIVEKIEELFSGLDSGVASLKKAKEQIRLYRQSVLAFAFSGRLLGEVRDDIFHVQDGELKDVISDSQQLPNGWKWVNFIDFCKLQRGYDLPLKNIQTGNYPVVTSGGINGYHNEFKAVGPCLITGRSGSVGNIHFFDVEKYWPHNTVLYVKDFCNNLPEFIYYYFIQFNFKKFSSSTAVPTLDRKKLYNEQIKLPPINQQTQIVSEIEKRFSEADNLEKAIDDGLTKAETLRQSILKEAFEGRLV